jgi:hypothetical protein
MKQEDNVFSESDFCKIFTMLKEGLESISFELSHDDYKLYTMLLAKFETPCKL